MANGVARPSENALNGSPKVWNPRVGVAWDVTARATGWCVAASGIYSNWLTPANIQEQFRGNPPGLILPTFFANSPSPPIFTQGTGEHAAVWIHVSRRWRELRCVPRLPVSTRREGSRAPRSRSAASTPT